MLHNARHAYATLTLCALTLGFAPRPRTARCTRLRLSPDRDELRKLRVKELQAELGKKGKLQANVKRCAPGSEMDTQAAQAVGCSGCFRTF